MAGQYHSEDVLLSGGRTDATFQNISFEFKKELQSYVSWCNNKRIHGNLNYMTPVEYRLAKMTE
ncbi:IS3 family transposase [Fervidicella metallireducens]|nr:IS3 family transposase [Fervidicella metallireducens]